MVEDRGPVLVAVVAELRIGCERINVAPEDVEKLFVTDLARVISNLYCLCVAGRTGCHLLVRRVLLGAAGIAGDSRDDSVNFIVRRLHAPKTTAGQSRRRGFSASGAWVSSVSKTR